MTTTDNAHEHGFMLVMSVVIINVILGLVIISVSRTIHTAGTAVLQEVFKAESKQAAHSCAQLVALRLANASHFGGSATWAIGGYRCVVGLISVPAQNNRLFSVSVSIQDIVSTYSVSMELEPFQIINIQQL